MKPQISTYSRMFLVTPTVYEKLLTCIDEKDKKVTEDLNISKDKKSRPSDEYINDLNIESFNEPREELEPNPEIDVNMDAQPETESADVIYQDEGNNDGFIQTDEPELMPETHGEILSSPCIQSEEGEVIPQGGLIYRPKNQQKQFKAVKKPVISIPRLSQKEIDSYTKPKVNQVRRPILSLPKLSQAEIGIYTKKSAPQISIPRLNQSQIGVRDNANRPIIRKPVLSIPRLQQAEINAFTEQPILSIPRLQEEQINAFTASKKQKQRQLIVPGIQKSKPGLSKIKNFQCPICFKFWRSKWDLRRHSGTVHSNIKTNQQAAPLPDTDDVMQDETNNFPDWNRSRPEKRTSSQAKLPLLKNTKFRPPGGEDEEGEYDSWK